MSGRLQVIGQKEIIATLGNIKLNVAKKVLRSALRKALKPMATDTKQAAPVGDGEPAEGHGHGEIKKNIKLRSGRRSRKGFSMIIQVQAADRDTNPYWSGFVERGTVKQRAQNWMLDVFNKDADTARAELIKLIRQGIEDLAKK